jgi:hypothetical protein
MTQTEARNNEKATIESVTARLRSFESEHRQLGLEMLQADNHAIYPLDLLAAAVLKRSMCLLDAYCDLIDKRNFVAAAPLLRLQLDSALRLHGAWLVKDPHKFATEMLAGKHVRNMRDRNNERMTDQYLLNSLSRQYPNLKQIYEHVSGYIHLSNKHIFNVLKLENDADRRFAMSISPTDTYVSEETYLEALLVFHAVTKVLFRYLQGWVHTKATKGAKQVG